jgi:hypothetical protein
MSKVDVCDCLEIISAFILVVSIGLTTFVLFLVA